MLNLVLFLGLVIFIESTILYHIIKKNNAEDLEDHEKAFQATLKVKEEERQQYKDRLDLLKKEGEEFVTNESQKPKCYITVVTKSGKEYYSESFEPRFNIDGETNVDNKYFYTRPLKLYSLTSLTQAESALWRVMSGDMAIIGRTAIPRAEVERIEIREEA